MCLTCFLDSDCGVDPLSGDSVSQQTRMSGAYSGCSGLNPDWGSIAQLQSIFSPSNCLVYYTFALVPVLYAPAVP